MVGSSSAQCASGYAVTGMNFSRDSIVDLPVGIQLVCSKLLYPVAVDTSDNSCLNNQCIFGSYPGTNQYPGISTQEPAQGIVGRSGLYVTALGLTYEGI